MRTAHPLMSSRTTTLYSGTIESLPTTVESGARSIGSTFTARPFLSTGLSARSDPWISQEQGARSKEQEGDNALLPTPSPCCFLLLDSCFWELWSRFLP